MAKIKVFSPANEEKLQIEFDKDMIIVRKELSEIEKRTKKSRSDKEKLLIASKRIDFRCTSTKVARTQSVKCVVTVQMNT